MPCCPSCPPGVEKCPQGLRMPVPIQRWFALDTSRSQLAGERSAEDSQRTQPSRSNAEETQRREAFLLMQAELSVDVRDDPSRIPRKIKFC